MRPLLIVCAWAAVAAADEPETTRITVVKSITATSTLAGKKKDGYAAFHILDGRNDESGEPPQTAWCEGKPDEGLGEAVTIAFDTPVVVAEVAIKAGFWKTEELFRANNRVTAIDVVTDDGHAHAVAFPDRMEEVTAPVGGAPTRTLSFRIAKVKKGKMNDSCIAGVSLKTEPESTLAVGMDPQLAAAINAAERALGGCDEKVIARALGFPFRWVPVSHDKDRFEYKSAAEVKASCGKADGEWPQPRVPGLDVDTKGKRVYVTDGACGADCVQWGFEKAGDVWKLVWIAPVWVKP
jgi:hypothetical protein